MSIKDLEEINKRLAKAAAEGFSEVEIDPPSNCDHGVVFDEVEYNKTPNMSVSELRKRWPRGWGPCPKGCGFTGIAYASYMHYIAGDW